MPGFLVSDPSQIEPLTGQPWNFWIVVIVATIGNTLGSLVAYAIGAYGGRPFLERYGKYLLIRPHEIELADSFFAAPRRGDGLHRPAAADRPDVHQLPGRCRPHADRPFIVYSTAGAFLWSIAARLRGHRAWRELGGHPPRAPAVRPRDRGRVVVAVVLLHLVAPRDAGPARAAPAERPRRPTTDCSGALLLGRPDRRGIRGT